MARSFPRIRASWLIGWRFDQSGERQLYLEGFFDLGEQANRQYRVAAQLKIVLLRANGSQAEKIFPNLL